MVMAYSAFRATPPRFGAVSKPFGSAYLTTYIIASQKFEQPDFTILRFVCCSSRLQRLILKKTSRKYGQLVWKIRRGSNPQPQA